MTDKRAAFFFLSALVCFGLIPVAQHQYRLVTLIVAVVYVVLGIASWLDYQSRHNPKGRRADPSPSDDHT